MTKPVQIALCTLLLTLSACAVFVSWRTSRMQQDFADAAAAGKITVKVEGLPNVQPTIMKANATLDAINAPCIGFHGSVTCGPLAQLSQTEKNIGIVAAQSALQVRQTGELITASAQTVKDVSVHLSRTADAATGTLNAASDTLGAGKATILALQPVIGHSDAAVQHLDALIQSKDLADAIHHANGMTGSGDVILANAAQVSTKAKEDYMKARTPWGKFVTTGLDLIHLGAYAAR